MEMCRIQGLIAKDYNRPVHKPHRQQKLTNLLNHDHTALAIPSN